jgi:hypothetical protein
MAGVVAPATEAVLEDSTKVAEVPSLVVVASGGGMACASSVADGEAADAKGDYFTVDDVASAVDRPTGAAAAAWRRLAVGQFLVE